MPKRRSDSDGREGDSTSKRRRRQHLYLVVDDWRWGYSIRKIDLWSTASDSDDADGEPETPAAAATDHTEERRLPSAVVRVEAPRGEPYHFTSGFGTTIMAMHPHPSTSYNAYGIFDRKHNAHPLVPRGLAAGFDVRTRGLVFVPRPKSRPSYHAIYVHLGDRRIFMLGAASFEELTFPPPPNEEEWSWRELRMPSFDPRCVTSHAVHPDGRAIFFSAGGFTFTFDASEDDGEGGFRWTRHGEWELPFAGRGHYDAALDAWVGLSDSDDHAGHLCSCDVVAPDAAAAAMSYDADADDHGGEGRLRQLAGPARKISKENLFDCGEKNPSGIRHVAATLVPVGGGGAGGSRYCLVQCTGIVCDDKSDDDEIKSYSYYQRQPEPVEDEGEWTASRFLYRLTTFSLKYDKNGDLTTGDTRRVRHYTMPGKCAAQGSYLIDPVAFWM